MNSTTPVVVDTDVVSFLFKAHSLAPAYQSILAGRSLAVSLITLAEIEYGMEAKNWGAAAVQLNIPLVTHNASDYAAVESLVLLTPRRPPDSSINPSPHQGMLLLTTGRSPRDH
jgi:predicted nucleic acid-binding protein